MPLTDRLRQPEYTGENRCVPCTIVNIAIAAGVSILTAIASTLLGTGIFVLSLGIIYFRGYLIPGTPMLIKRYFPERVLRWFNKDAAMPMAHETVEIDPERVLLDAGAVELCQEDTDLCLRSDFQQAWRKHIITVRTQDPDEVHLLTSALNIPSGGDRITVDQRGDVFVAYTGDAVISQWSSRAAVIADVAAATELGERVPNWQRLAPAEIARVLMSLRIFIDRCPECDDLVEVGEEVVESCCRSYDVVASTCQNCDVRLFEIEWDDTAANDDREQPDQPVEATA